MSTHLTRDLSTLHRNLLAMCATVEELVHQAVDDLCDPNIDGARELARRDDEVDRFDVSIEEECLKILALHQPVATDLRRITTVLKISSELERVADISVHIAERASSLVNQPGIEVPERMREMAKRAVEMLHHAIDAYVGLDSHLARQVTESDNVVDELNREIIEELVAMMKRDPALLEPGLSLFSASRHIERVADHATNIAEDVVYLVEGEIIGIEPISTDMSKPKILVIEDERSLIDILSYNLAKEGFEVLTASDGHEGLRRALAMSPDVVVLDLMLPGIDGLQICRQLRSDARTKNVRILMLTAKSEEVDEIVGFNMGADDYVTKPFKLKPLIHRIKALLRRPSPEQSTADVLRLQGLEVDRTHHVAKSDGQVLDLTPTEFKILWTLMRRPGRPYSRNELLDNSRGEDANALERTIDVHVRSLRHKLGDKADLIETVRSIGYRFKAE